MCKYSKSVGGGFLVPLISATCAILVQIIDKMEGEEVGIKSATITAIK